MRIMLEGPQRDDWRLTPRGEFLRALAEGITLLLVMAALVIAAWVLA